MVSILSSRCQLALPTEQNGFLMVEAEAFTTQHANSRRSWVTIDDSYEALKEIVDPDTAHFVTASGGSYIKALPDTRVTHDDSLAHGVNFSNIPGEVAVLDYKVRIQNPGRYFVWVSAYSSGTEDNGIHVGIDGSWPESGQRMQWCEGKNSWHWESKQRTKEVHCGVEKLIYLDVPTAGIHTISFSMREDGFEFDRFVLSKEYRSP